VEDIPLLVHDFVARYAAKVGRAITRVPAEAMRRLETYPWPGNVRELENIIERAVIVATGDTLTDVERFLAPTGAHAPVDLSLPFRDAKARVVEDFERAYIDGLLKSHGGKLTAAAKHADMDPKNFSDKMQRYGMRRATPPDPPTTQGTG
jgi:DNA-binding NtrC family response regulator